MERNPAIPGLAHQPERYLTEQLALFKLNFNGRAAQPQKPSW